MPLLFGSLPLRSLLPKTVALATTLLVAALSGCASESNDDEGIELPEPTAETEALAAGKGVFVGEVTTADVRVALVLEPAAGDAPPYAALHLCGTPGTSAATDTLASSTKWFVGTGVDLTTPDGWSAHFDPNGLEDDTRNYVRRADGVTLPWKASRVPAWGWAGLYRATHPTAPAAGDGSGSVGVIVWRERGNRYGFRGSFVGSGSPILQVTPLSPLPVGLRPSSGLNVAFVSQGATARAVVTPVAPRALGAP